MTIVEQDRRGRLVRRPETSAAIAQDMVAGGVEESADASAAPSSLADWRPVLQRLGVPLESARRIEARAEASGVPFQTELLVSGLVGERDLFRALADELGLAFAEAVRPGSLVMRERDCLSALSRRGGVRIAMALEGHHRAIVLIAPDRLNIPELRRHIACYPKMAARLRVAPPSALRRAVIALAGPAVSRDANNRLFEALPACSARFVVSAWQGAILGAAAIGLPVAFTLAPMTTNMALHGLFSGFFLSCVALRLAVGGTAGPLKFPSLRAFRPADMPVYTVLVALYKEAEIVPDLLVALGRIVWPRGKLEIKLVCEADDEATLGALRAQSLRPFIEVIEVPAEGPRTKPKALAYALPMTSGDFVALYDAEDKPHPLQLVEAWQRFQESGSDLACLQAPLVISNRRRSRVAQMFGFEYAALFRGLLPWLARRQHVLPLGGTSNHFRRRALDNVGAWDPCNVTEDADLGLRLKRFGYRTGMIAYPTYEDAPDTIRIWLPQRIRWFKGWLQTWLVHMRGPLELARELGAGSFTLTQILYAGAFISALFHPVLLATAIWILAEFAFGGVPATSHSVLLAVDVANIVGGYGAFLALGWLTLSEPERRGFWRIVLLTPVYWILISCAAWRSLWQLYRRPHHWSKTPHRPRRRFGQPVRAESRNRRG